MGVRATPVLRDDGTWFPGAGAAAASCGKGVRASAVLEACRSGGAAGGHGWRLAPEGGRLRPADPTAAVRTCSRCARWTRVFGDAGRCSDGRSACAGDTCAMWDR